MWWNTKGDNWGQSSIDGQYVFFKFSCTRIWFYFGLTSNIWIKLCVTPRNNNFQIFHGCNQNLTLYVLNLFFNYDYMASITYFFVGQSPVTVCQRRTKTCPDYLRHKLSPAEPPSPQRQPAGISQVIFVLKDKEKKTMPCQQKQAKGTWSGHFWTEPKIMAHDNLNMFHLFSLVDFSFTKNKKHLKM